MVKSHGRRENRSNEKEHPHPSSVREEKTRRIRRVEREAKGSFPNSQTVQGTTQHLAERVPQDVEGGVLREKKALDAFPCVVFFGRIGCTPPAATFVTERATHFV